eukprot:CAMPEP_0175040416 /NCGR_PEP_ID=MMETSP0052_2-20121109/1248_1 /TAXON_ID=51329 ORGANISM="Polytomella parva, Strain SAG 63-3" /NCGR_SAMPLE_ID=MMETSP0052_2 /ASSEMBLY_ACC=CAM_ASM_000194 /LENGTH=494 /DNA_ID=CAMNT_0016302619 /DNA_START=65 /DNA_END=1546 /DNA_ORIENTATION=-
MDKTVIKDRFKTSEGRFNLQVERCGAISFSASVSTRLTLAHLYGDPEELIYVIYNVGEYIHVSRLHEMDKDPLRSFLCKGRLGFPTCHSFTRYPDDGDSDLLVGCADGSIYMCSLRYLLSCTSPPAAPKDLPGRIVSLEGAVDWPTELTERRCLALSWVPLRPLNPSSTSHPDNFPSYTNCEIYGGPYNGLIERRRFVAAFQNGVIYQLEKAPTPIIGYNVAHSAVSTGSGSDNNGTFWSFFRKGSSKSSSSSIGGSSSKSSHHNHSYSAGSINYYSFNGPNLNGVGSGVFSQYNGAVSGEECIGGSVGSTLSAGASSNNAVNSGNGTNVGNGNFGFGVGNSHSANISGTGGSISNNGGTINNSTTSNDNSSGNNNSSSGNNSGNNSGNSSSNSNSSNNANNGSNKVATVITTFRGFGISSDLAMAPDGVTVAAACRDGVLRLLDLKSNDVISLFTGYYGALLCCAFSTDGRYIAAGGEDDMITVYGIAERNVV